EKVVSLLVPESTEKYQSAAISYGATGTGKTFWQQRLQKAVGAELLKSLPENGDPDGPGVLQVSMVEVLESCSDLLAPPSSNPAVILQEGSGSLYDCLPFYKVRTVLELEAQLSQANQARHTDTTEKSPLSSRTHLVCIMRTDHLQVTLVDLAGSERASDRREHTGKQLAEAKAINWSLACLHECVRHVADGSSHVPLRRTPLTRLLECVLTKSLSQQIVWIAHVHPCSRQLGHSLHTFSHAGEIVKAGLAQQRRNMPWQKVQPKMWTKEQLSTWVAESFPAMPPDTFSWADGATFGREWEMDLVKRAELAGASKEDATAAYEAFHARAQAG
ncbi:KIN8A, partial [Symbiodinium pilosum]